MNFLIQWIIYTIAIGIAAYVLPGVRVEGAIAALIAALILGIVNAVLRPLLVLLTLPVTVVTLGLFVFVINAFLVLLAAAIVPGFYVAGFGWALLFSIVLMLVHLALKGLAK
ncbi:MAG: phage holin family protein [bacterium]|nr:phage holin family protein [bacterium]